ncbi:MAG: hypothetical protein SFU25_09720 [Candidatus Caenarcaniphilales bacterium]|nr:hypothetical protein [Candidatus Caenarcaniphilales bacterium]
MKDKFLSLGLLLATSVPLISVAQNLPFPKKIYQAPICAHDEASLKIVKASLKNEDNKTFKEAQMIMDKHLSEGRLLSAQELLKELKEQVRKDKNTSSPEILEALNQRIATLEQKITANGDQKVYVFDDLIRDVTEESLYTTQNYNYDVLRKLCNGGKQESAHPFEIYEFTSSREAALKE